MNIQRAIEILEAIEAEYGSDLMLEDDAGISIDNLQALERGGYLVVVVDPSD
jgi:hypothetical protein